MGVSERLMVYPPDLTYPAEKTETARYAASVIAGLAAQRGVVVQAGGCVGLWPLALAQHFARVYTFEPAATNFRCLQANTEGMDNIIACAAALGDRRASVGLTRPKAQAGLWRVEGEGDVPMVPLDDVLGDVAMDALVLDVEGSEVPAWRGAERLITTHRPLLWFEGLQHTDAITSFLAAHDYGAPRYGIGGDCYSVHTSRD